MAFAETQKLTVQLDLAGNFQAKVASAARSLQGLDKATTNTQRSLSKFGRNIERGIVVGAGAAVAGFVAVAKAAGDFEAQLNTIGTIVDRKELPAIGEQLRKVARDTGISLDDLSQAYYDLASAGVKGQLATEALNDAVKLSIGGLATTQETVDLLTTAINAYGLDAKGAAKATDQFAQAVADGKVKASEIAASFSDIAAIAKQTGVGIDQIAASYAYLTAQGVPATEVTTEMQRAIISLLSPSKDLAKAGKALGVSWDQEIRKKGLVPALQEIVTYADKTHTPLIDFFGRIEAVKYALQTTGSNFKPFNAELAKMGQVSGVAAAQMAERQQGLNFQLARLKALVKDAAITIGSELLPKLTPLVEKLDNFISTNHDKIGKFGKDLADNFQKLADALGKVDWQPFIDGLKLSADIAKTAISAFRSMPEDLQKIVIAGFAVNKITGGLGTSIVKDLGGALVGQFAGRGSSPANPLFVTQVGGVGGPGGGGLPILGALGIAAAIDLAAVPIGKAFADALPDWLKGPGGTGMSQSQAAHAAADAARNGGLSTRPITGDGRTVSVLRTFAGKIKDDLSGPADILRGAAAEFKGAVSRLAHPKSQAELVSAFRETAKLLTSGRGSANDTVHAIESMKKQLGHIHDPKLRAEFAAQLRKVEGLLPGRAFAAKELAKANQILKSHETGNQKIRELQAIERALKDRGLPHAAATISAKIAAAQRAQVYAARGTTEAIKDKDLSVKVNVAAVANISIRDLQRAQAISVRWGQTSSASSGK